MMPDKKRRKIECLVDQHLGLKSNGAVWFASYPNPIASARRYGGRAPALDWPTCSIVSLIGGEFKESILGITHDDLQGTVSVIARRLADRIRPQCERVLTDFLSEALR